MNNREIVFIIKKELMKFGFTTTARVEEPSRYPIISICDEMYIGGAIISKRFIPYFIQKKQVAKALSNISDVLVNADIQINLYFNGESFYNNKSNENI